MDRWRQHPPAVETTQSSFNYNAPLRSVRGDAAAPSPYYMLSSELSRESLRIPGAVPFLWEQTPGRRKFAASAAALPPPSPPPPDIPSSNPTKPTLAGLLRQPSLRAPALPSSVLAAIRPIAAPPAADHPGSSSARYSVVHQRTPPPLVDNDDDAASDATSNAFTATAGGLSVDDSFVSGAVRLSTTASDARDFIMRRFLPAAHAIACDSPQTPSRRFVPPPSRNGVDARSSPLCYASAPTTSTRAPPPRWALIRSQLASVKNEDYGDEDDDHDDDDDAQRGCGVFTYNRIRNALLRFYHRAIPASPSRSKKQHKKSMKNRAVSRLGDILSEDASYDDDQDERLRSQLQRNKRPPRAPKYYDTPSRFSPAARAGATFYTNSVAIHAESQRFTQPNHNNNYNKPPNPAHFASAISSNFETPRTSMSGDSIDAEYKHDNLQQKPHLNNANWHDEEMIKGTNYNYQPGALLSLKSPTQSWLGRAIPLSTKSPSPLSHLSTKNPSPLSHLYKETPPKTENSLEDSKWERKPPPTWPLEVFRGRNSSINHTMLS